MANLEEQRVLNFFAMSVREFVGAARIKDGDPAKIIAGIFFFSLAFIFSGAETTKVYFRKNFAKGAVGFFQVLIGSIALILWGVWALTIGGIIQFGTDNMEEARAISVIAGSINFALTGLFYIIIGIYTLKCGYTEWRYPAIHGSELGESVDLGFLRKDGWSEYKIKQKAEPLTLLSVGVLFFALNPLLGIPLLFFGLSVGVLNLLSFKKAVDEAPLTVIQGGRNIEDDENLVR
jgi:hypothetical protein